MIKKRSPVLEHPGARNCRLQLWLTPLRQAPRRGGSRNPQNVLKGSRLVTRTTPTLCFLFPCIPGSCTKWESWGRGPDVAPALDSLYFFFFPLRSLPLFSRGWREGGVRARLRSLGGCTLRHHHPQRSSSGQSVAS